jgi:hypothetical protein
MKLIKTKRKRHAVLLDIQSYVMLLFLSKCSGLSMASIAQRAILEFYERRADEYVKEVGDEETQG